MKKGQLVQRKEPQDNEKLGWTMEHEVTDEGKEPISKAQTVGKIF